MKTKNYLTIFFIIALYTIVVLNLILHYKDVFFMNKYIFSICAFFILISVFILILLIMFCPMEQKCCCKNYNDFTLIHYTKDGCIVTNSDKLESLLEKAENGDKIKCNVDQFSIRTIVKSKNQTNISKTLDLTYSKTLHEFTVNIKNK